MNLVGITEKGGKKLLTETLTRRCLKLSGEIQTLEDLLAEITTREEVVCLFEQVEVLLEPGSWENSWKLSIRRAPTRDRNPPGNTAEGHRKVLMKEADTAVILFPADRVYTASFEQFLRENASRLLENSLLLVTMMDRVPRRAAGDSGLYGRKTEGKISPEGSEDPVLCRGKSQEGSLLERKFSAGKKKFSDLYEKREDHVYPPTSDGAAGTDDG